MYTHLKTPFPKTMKITDVPRVRIFDDAYYQTFYKTLSMKNSFTFPTFSQIISFEEYDKVDNLAKTVKYGPYKDVEPFTSHPINVHVTYN